MTPLLGEAYGLNQRQERRRCGPVGELWAARQTLPLVVPGSSKGADHVGPGDKLADFQLVDNLGSLSFWQTQSIESHYLRLPPVVVLKFPNRKVGQSGVSLTRSHWRELRGFATKWARPEMPAGRNSGSQLSTIFIVMFAIRLFRAPPQAGMFLRRSLLLDANSLCPA